MANFTSSASPFSALLHNPILASSVGPVDDPFDDACSICLEGFTLQDPASVTSCKHEYHLHCILEWSQRSSDCPNCLQLFVLNDPASHELLAAVESERLSRSTNLSHDSLTPHNRYEDVDVEQNGSYSDDSDFDEQIMQHLAAAASRARYFQRRDMQRSSAANHSQVLVFSSPVNAPNLRQTYPTTQREGENLSDSSIGDSPVSGSPLPVNAQSLPCVANTVSTSTGIRGILLKPRVLYRQPPHEGMQKATPSETVSFADSIKSKWFATSNRYKESISKGTRGIKEKLLSRNTTVKDMSKGVQREMSAGMARMMERLDLSSRRTKGESSSCGSKGKGVLEDHIAGKTSILSSGSPTHVSVTLANQLRVSSA